MTAREAAFAEGTDPVTDSRTPVTALRVRGVPPVPIAFDDRVPDDVVVARLPSGDFLIGRVTAERGTEMVAIVMQADRSAAVRRACAFLGWHRRVVFLTDLGSDGPHTYERIEC